MNYKIVLVDDEKLIADGYCYSLMNKYSNLECKVFYNSIDRAVNTVKRLGVDVITETVEEDNCKRVTIIVRK